MKASDLYDGVLIRPYNSWSDIKLSSEAQKIQTGMTENPLFPAPSPTMVVFSEAVNAYVLQLVKEGPAIRAPLLLRMHGLLPLLPYACN